MTEQEYKDLSKRDKKLADIARKFEEQQEQTKEKLDKIEASFKPSAMAPPPAAGHGMSDSPSSAGPAAFSKWQPSEYPQFGKLGQNMLETVGVAFGRGQGGFYGEEGKNKTDNRDLIDAIRELINELRSQRDVHDVQRGPRGYEKEMRPLPGMVRRQQQPTGSAGSAMTGLILSSALRAFGVPF